jgi:hypothetical protein
VHVAAEDDLLAEHLPVVLGQVVVAGLVGHLLVPPVGERVGAGGGDPQALAFAQLGLGRGQDPRGHRAQLAGLGVDKLVLLLDPEGERLAQLARPRSRSTNCR